MNYLDSLIGSPEASANMNNLARSFREEFQLPETHQLGCVVPSISPTAKQLEERGLPEFMISTGRLAVWRERGDSREFQATLGISYADDIQVELLEPGIGSDFYSQLLDDSDRVRLHHLGFFVLEMESYRAKLEAAGYPVYIEGKTDVGSLTVDFLYFDTLNKLGFFMELICWSHQGKAFIPEKEMFARMAIKQKAALAKK